MCFLTIIPLNSLPYITLVSFSLGYWQSVTMSLGNIVLPWFFLNIFFYYILRFIQLMSVSCYKFFKTAFVVCIFLIKISLGVGVSGWICSDSCWIPMASSTTINGLLHIISRAPQMWQYSNCQYWSGANLIGGGGSSLWLLWLLDGCTRDITVIYLAISELTVLFTRISDIGNAINNKGHTVCAFSPGWILAHKWLGARNWMVETKALTVIFLVVIQVCGWLQHKVTVKKHLSGLYPTPSGRVCLTLDAQQEYKGRTPAPVLSWSLRDPMCHWTSPFISHLFRVIHLSSFGLNGSFPFCAGHCITLSSRIINCTLRWSWRFEEDSISFHNVEECLCDPKDCDMQR